MPEIKQIQDLGDLLQHVITDISIGKDNISFTRSDGIEYEISLPEPESGEAGEDTPGVKGSSGESAYDIAMRLGMTEDIGIEEWLKSFKGEAGANTPNGIDAEDPTDGIDGSIYPIEFKSLSWLLAGNEPEFTLEKKGDIYEMRLGIPLNFVGKDGADAIKPTLTMGDVVLSEIEGVEASGYLETDNDKDYELFLTIPRGDVGPVREALSGKNAWAPKIIVTTEYVGNEEPLRVIKSDDVGIVGEPWTQRFTVQIPRGLPADEGPMGYQGNKNGVNSDAVFKLISVPEYIQNPGAGFSCFTADIFGDQKTVAYGYCWRLADITKQICRVMGRDGHDYREGWYYRTGPGDREISSKITEGWIKRG